MTSSYQRLREPIRSILLDRLKLEGGMGMCAETSVQNYR
jgi:hypothetical protein